MPPRDHAREVPYEVLRTVRIRRAVIVDAQAFHSGHPGEHGDHTLLLSHLSIVSYRRLPAKSQPRGERTPGSLQPNEEVDGTAPPGHDLVHPQLVGVGSQLAVKYGVGGVRGNAAGQRPAEPRTGRCTTRMQVRC